VGFGFFRSVEVLLMVVLGGMGSLTGSLVGGLLITVLPEVLRFLGPWRLVIYSLLLILFMIFRPGGLLGSSELRLPRPRLPGIPRLAKDSGGGDAAG
jgi:branched-chain amino acid transport system permease protein